jgi:hypothetical protein
MTMVKTTNGSSYTGLTSATIHGSLYLYAANFGKGRVDVYDSSFHRVRLGEEQFNDDWLPPEFVPFNVQAIGNDIVVAYALHEKGNMRLEHGDWLNAPWGVALAPLDFGRFSHDLLIAQFAGGGSTQFSGVIAAYDLVTGRFEGLLEDAAGSPLAINGIWAISPGNASPGNLDSAAAPSAAVYFTAGPSNGAGGLLGYLTAVSTDLIEGNNQ